MVLTPWMKTVIKKETVNYDKRVSSLWGPNK